MTPAHLGCGPYRGVPGRPDTDAVGQAGPVLEDHLTLGDLRGMKREGKRSESRVENMD